MRRTRCGAPFQPRPRRIPRHSAGRRGEDGGRPRATSPAWNSGPCWDGWTPMSCGELPRLRATRQKGPGSSGLSLPQRGPPAVIRRIRSWTPKPRNAGMVAIPTTARRVPGPFPESAWFWTATLNITAPRRRQGRRGLETMRRHAALSGRPDPRRPVPGPPFGSSETDCRPTQHSGSAVPHRAVVA